jgi:hypothetical protein
MTAVFTDYTTPYTTYTVVANGITVTKKSNNKITPVKGSSPVIVRLGRTASISVTCKVYGDTDLGIINGWGGETVIVVSASSYAQLPNGNYLLKGLEIKEKPGYLKIFDVKFDLEYYYAGGII